MDKKYFKAIDIARLFFAFCIVAIHTFAFEGLLSNVNYWYLEKMIFRLGVPFFFIVSGFFIGKKIYSNPANVSGAVKKYIKKLGIPLVVFQIINLILRGTLQFLEGDSIFEIILRSIRSVIFYPYGALWYIQASIVAIILLYYFIKNNKMNIAIAIGFLFYAVGLLANSYYFLVEGTFLAELIDVYLYIASSARNGIFVGFLLLGIGIWISDKVRFWNTNNLKRNALIAFTGSFTLYFIEVSYLYGKNVKDSADLLIFLPIVTASLFILLSTIDINISVETSKKQRRLSTGLYFLHAPVRDTIRIFLTVSGSTMLSIHLFIIVTLVCLIMLLLIYRYKTAPLYNLLG